MNKAKHAIYMTVLALGAGIIAPLSGTDALAALEIGRQGAVSFVSGGVGEDERQKITTLAPAYALELLFARQGSPNEFLADIKVQIKDGGGNVVLDAVSQGPFLLAKVPPGLYTVSADNDGVTKQQTIRIKGSKSHRVVFVW